MEIASDKELSRLALNDRVLYVSALAHGFTTSAEAQQIMRLFRTAPPDHVRELYEYVENKSWKGELFHAPLKRADTLWRALGAEDRKALNALIQGSSKD